MVQEDNALAHKSHYQEEVYNLWKIMKIIWPGNSPDVNTVKPTWFYIKRETTKKGPTSNRKKLRVRWEECWEDLPQRKIQEWIKAIPYHIQEIIQLKGGNKYKEGRKKGQEKTKVYT